MDADSELIVSWLVAGRDAESAYASFANELADQIVSLDWLLSGSQCEPMVEVHQ